MGLAKEMLGEREILCIRAENLQRKVAAAHVSRVVLTFPHKGDGIEGVY